MNTFSHLLMGNFLCDYMQEHYGIALDRAGFLYGNILPDYRISFLTRPHYLENNIDYLQSELRGLLHHKQDSAYCGKSFSKHLGIVCHYYADFFCFAHSDGFSGGLIKHITYERRLHRYLQEHGGELGGICFLPKADTSEDERHLYRCFDTLHEQYLASKQSFGNDLVYMALACVDVIFALANAMQPEETAVVDDTLEYIPA